MVVEQGRRPEGRDIPQYRAQRIRPDRRRPAHRRDQETAALALPNNSGVLSTAGGIVFTGTTDGTLAT
jgi:hypothetical protein